MIVCVPSGITPVERDTVEQATLDAGATRAFLIEEPLAAAIGAGLPVGDAIGSLIVDIGGGTSEMGITALGGLVVAHSIRVGGYELDDAIVHLLQDREMLLVGQGQAEAVKLEIGSADVGVEVPGTAEVAGRSLTTGLLRRAVVDADQVRSALSRPLAHIVDAVKNVLERTPPELSSDIAQRGLMLVGGGALLPGLDILLRRETGLPITVDGEPLTTVARGAGHALEELEGLEAPSGRRQAKWRRESGARRGDKGEPDDDDVLVV